MIDKLRLKISHGASLLLHAYADFRIGATESEKRCHKESPSVLFTFDDYGSEDEINELLAILSDNKIKAVFFLIGEWADDHPALVKKIDDSGHVLGNHTYSHPNLLKISNKEVESEIKRGIRSRWLRAPQGRTNRRIRRLANNMGFSLCYWTIDSRDWAGTSVQTMRHTILSEIHPGAVILFHINARHTLELLPGLIDDLYARGYTLTGRNETW